MEENIATILREEDCGIKKKFQQHEKKQSCRRRVIKNIMPAVNAFGIGDEIEHDKRQQPESADEVRDGKYFAGDKGGFV